MDFTISTYRALLNELTSQDYYFQTLGEFIQNPEKKAVILRHDVDAYPVYALNTAYLEYEMGIRATYYFKTKAKSYDKRIIKEIHQLGHEIGYHYDDLSTAKGDYEKAITEFAKNLEFLRQVVPVKTICMDGNAYSRWDNLRLWEKYDYKDYDILVEPYLDLDFNKILYLTDTGRKWNAVKYSRWDKVKTSFDYYNKNTCDIISDIKQGKLPDQLLINTHPQRWHNVFLPWLKELVMQNVKNVVKRMVVGR